MKVFMLETRMVCQDCFTVQCLQNGKEYDVDGVTGAMLIRKGWAQVIRGDVDATVNAAALRATMKECAASPMLTELESMFADMMGHRPVNTNPATFEAKGEKL